MTDIPYYQIKELMKDNNINKKQATSIMNCIKYKIIIFYSFTFLLFLFFWYLISAFCAVYIRKYPKNICSRFFIKFHNGIIISICNIFNSNRIKTYIINFKRKKES